MNQTCYALASKDRAGFYLYCAFRQLVESLVQAAHGSVFDTITTKTLERASITHGPGEVVKEFEAIVSPLFDRMLIAQNENQTLAAMRDLLLPKLMSGEIRLKDAEKIAEAAE